MGLIAGACSAPVEDRQNVGEQFQESSRRIVTDMRGKEVWVPKQIDRVVTISDGFLAGVMSCLGVADKIVGLGSRCVQLHYNYHYPGRDGAEYQVEDGVNTVTLLQPWLSDLPLVAASNLALNFETLAGLAPDIVLLRSGCCTLGDPEDERTQKAIASIEQLGIPVVLLKGPPAYDRPHPETISAEIRLLGQLFQKEDQAKRLVQQLETYIQHIRSRTEGIPQEAKPRTLLLGLSPRVRASGGAGNTKGSDTMESFFIEQVANGRNAYKMVGGRAGYLMLSVEQIYALAPDVILLPTSSGYHPPEELYFAPYFRKLQQLDAVKNKRVYALPWTPCNCAKRIEYPIEAMIIAKAMYPQRFTDIKVNEWVLDFYRDIYGVDKATALRLRSAQWLDWTISQDF